MNLPLILSTAVALFAGVAGWTANGWRLNTQIAEIRKEHVDMVATAERDAAERYRTMEQRKQEALDEANRLSQRNARAAAIARAESERLRNQVVASSTGVSAATLASLRDYTATLAVVFGECVTEVEGLAATADGHAIDSRTLMKAWPK